MNNSLISLRFQLKITSFISFVCANKDNTCPEEKRLTPFSNSGLKIGLFSYVCLETSDWETRNYSCIIEHSLFKKGSFICESHLSHKCLSSLALVSQHSEKRVREGRVRCMQTKIKLENQPLQRRLNLHEFPLKFSHLENYSELKIIVSMIQTCTSSSEKIFFLSAVLYT